MPRCRRAKRGLYVLLGALDVLLDPDRRRAGCRATCSPASSLPQVRVEDMLRQVDRWTSLKRALTPSGGHEPKIGGKDAYRTLLAALIA